MKGAQVLNNISFAEKDAYISSPNSYLTRQKLVPVYMVKDGGEYFVANLPIEGGSYSPEYHFKEMEGYKTQLLQNGGKYFKFNGIYDDPAELIGWAAKKKYTFECSAESNIVFNKIAALFHYNQGFVNFCGNLREVSSAFHYRIYGMSFAEDLKKQLANYLRH